MNKKITLLPGDGIGPEIVGEAVKVLDRIAEKFLHKFEYTTVDIGGCSIDKYGVPITDEGMALCKSADSVLLGAVGGPKWDNCPPSIRPEKALLGAGSQRAGALCEPAPNQTLPPACLRVSPQRERSRRRDRSSDCPGAHRRGILRAAQDRRGERRTCGDRRHALFRA